MTQVIGLRYDHGGGGHFMANVLSLHPRILGPYKPQCIKKLSDRHTHWQSLGTALMPIVQSMMFNAHFEYNITELYPPKKLWQDIMSQDKYIPTVQDPNEDPAQLLGTMHVRGVNLDWIQKVRSKFMRELRNQVEIRTLEKIPGMPTIDFDMSSILDEQRFADSVREITSYFNLSDIDSEWLDIARRLWILNVSIVNHGIASKNVLSLMGQKEFEQDEEWGDSSK